MLEEKIKDFKLGYKISYEAFRDIINPEKVKADQQIILQKIEAFKRNMSYFEAIGFLTNTLENIVKHPYKMYKILTK